MEEDDESALLAAAIEPYFDDIMSHLKDNDSNAYWQLQDAYGQYALSDAEEKYVQDLASRGAPFSHDEMRFLMRMAGKDEENNIDPSDESEWSEDVLDKYAEHLRNYLYTYKKEAQRIDPSIDPNEEHIGIMAQDLEQVNPACVKETENGTKVVDTNRLALMNAGAIGDLAREMQELKERLAALEG